MCGHTKLVELSQYYKYANTNVKYYNIKKP